MDAVNPATTRLYPVIRWMGQRGKGFLFLVAILLDILLGLIDWITGYEISFSLFYLIPVALVSRCAGKLQGVLISVICAGTWLVSDLAANHVYSHPAIPYWNALVRLGFFLIVGLALIRMRCSMEFLEEMSRIDPLTGAANPRGFQEQAHREIEIARRYGHPFTVAYLDLDNFKAVNDSLGHSTGDELLMSLAELVRSSIRETDVLARLGGDEFAILFSETGSEAAQRAMARTNRSISQEMRAKGWPVTLSVGLLTFVVPPKSVDEMIQKADDLMYEAKTSGKNTVKVGLYHPSA